MVEPYRLIGKKSPCGIFRNAFCFANFSLPPIQEEAMAEKIRKWMNRERMMRGEEKAKTCANFQ